MLLRLKPYVIILIAIIFIMACNTLFTSCTNDDGIPRLIIDKDSLGCFPGDTAKINITASIEPYYTSTRLERLKVEILNGASNILLLDTGTRKNPLGGFNKTIAVRVPNGTDHILKIWATAFSTNGEKSENSVVIFPFYESEYVWMGTGSDSIYPPFLNVRKIKGIYASEAATVSEDVDMCYYYDSFYKGCVYSPGDAGFGDLKIEGTNQKSWPHHKATTFRSFQNNNINFHPALYSAHGLEALYQSGTTETTYIHHITEYKKYLFRNEAGNYGVIEIYPNGKGPKSNVGVSIFLQK